MTRKSITKDEIRLLPLGYFEGEAIVVRGKEDLKKAFTVLEREKVIGIDTEAKPNFVKGKFNPVPLLQLATKTRCYLFPLVRYGLSEELKSILESPKIIKAGVATRQDMKELERDYGVRAQNLLDLNNLAKRTIRISRNRDEPLKPASPGMTSNTISTTDKIISRTSNQFQAASEPQKYLQEPSSLHFTRLSVRNNNKNSVSIIIHPLQ